MLRLRPPLTGAALALFATTAFAWNDFGHMLVAAMAYQGLQDSPQTRSKVDALIALNPRYKTWIQGVPVWQRGEVAFLMASRWPDAIKHDKQYFDDGDGGGESPVEPVASRNVGYQDKARHKYWHYKDVGFSTDGSAVESAKVPNVETTIVLFRSTLASANASAALKSYDLTWLVHLVGDIHQPLHATSRFSADLPHGDIGGNKVALCAAPCRDDLHGFWDQVLGSDENPAAAIATAKTLPSAPTDLAQIADVAVWVAESLKSAQVDVYAPPIGEAQGPYTLDGNYRAHAKEVAQRRIAVAGARLGHLIRDALK